VVVSTSGLGVTGVYLPETVWHSVEAKYVTCIIPVDCT